MPEVSEAANRVYLLGPYPPVRYAVIHKPDGTGATYGIRAHNPLGANWRTVWEEVDAAREKFQILHDALDQQLTSHDEQAVTVDGYKFTFSGPECCELPKLVTDIHKPEH